MSKILFDMEADGLHPSTIWCISLMDITHQTRRHYGPDRIDEAIKQLQEADTLIGHNILCFDMYHIKRLYGVDLYDKEIIDTLVLSRLHNPDREGGHGLEAWGNRLGYKKQDHEEWGFYSPEMKERCDKDVILNYKVYQKLQAHAKYFPKEVVELEQAIARIIHEQSEYGWYMDVKKAWLLHAEINDELGRLEDTVRQTFRPKQIYVKTVTPKLKKDGTLSKSGLRDDEFERIAATGGTFDGEGVYDMAPFDRFETVEFNLGSRAMIGRWLMEDFGWEPTEHTPTGQPMINEKILEKVEGIPEVSMIHRYLMLQKILAFVDNWLTNVGEDDRIRGYVKTIGAVTRRMTHSNPNLAQVPSSRKEYGKECRELFTVPEGYRLVGVDAEGLELRMMAHYMDNPAYTEAVVNGDSNEGTDAHSVNMRAAGLSNRDQAKTMFYALIYGAGDAKIGSIIGRGTKAGKELKFKLFNELPDLGDLIAKVKLAAERGFIKGLDGSILHVRAVNAALNVLLQGGGAIIMKRALKICYDDATAAGLDFHFVGNIHDEYQTEVKAEHAEQFARIAEDSIRKAGEYYNLKCPMAGSAKIGTTWAETH